MPYVIDVPRYLPGCFNWSDTPQTPEGSAKKILLNRIGRETVPPIPFVQAHHEEDLKVFPVPTKLPDIFHGRWSGSVFVSDRFKSVVMELDPVEHIFQPVDLSMMDGTHYPSGFYALGIGDRVEAIDAANSELVAKFLDGKTVRSIGTKGVKDILAKGEPLGRFMFFAAAVGDPFIQWHKESIAGRHLWMDKFYPSEAFISDELAQLFKTANITGLELRPSAVD